MSRAMTPVKEQHDSREPDVVPGRASCQPAAIVALLVLVANDHWFKATPLLSGTITGKLSDLAGLYLAPIVLACVFAVRTRRALLGCHLATALVFVAINVSPRAADFLCYLLESFGLPWAIVTDPSDLWTLVIMPLSFVASSRPASSPREHSARRRPILCRPWTTRATVTVQAMACAASGSAGEGGESSSVVEGSVFFFNSGTAAIEIRIAQLDESAQLDCDRIASDPGRLLSPALFGGSFAWTVDAARAIAINPIAIERSYDCDASLVEAPGLPPSVVFWQHRDHPWKNFDAQLAEASDPPEGVIVLEFENDDLRGFQHAGGDLVFTLNNDPPADGLPAACPRIGDAERIEWSENFPTGTVELRGVTEGLDGCLGLALDGVAGTSAESGEDLFYVCIPPDMFPFEAGPIDVERSSLTDDLGGGRTVSLTFSDPKLDDPTDLDSSGTRFEVVLSKGSGVASMDGFEFEGVPALACGFEIDDDCGTATRPSALAVRSAFGSSATLTAGGPAEVFQLGPDRVSHMQLLHGEQRPALRVGCTPGSANAGFDFDLVVVHHYESGATP